MGRVQTSTVADRVPSIRSLFSRQAILVGGIVGALVNLNALFIPPFAVLGGGPIAGFVGGYIVGGPVRGTVHGTLAGAVVGLASGAFVATLGALVGLYTQPPTIIGDAFTILVPPMVDRAGAIEPLLVLAGIAALTVFDGFVGGVLGGTTRSFVDRLAGRE